MWRWFITESKAYMNYPRCGRWLFWRHLPLAFAIFTWLNLMSRLQVYMARIRRVPK